MTDSRLPPLGVNGASAKAADLIRGAILDGRLRPGDRLKETNLAEQLQVSRTPVREALLVLQAEGLVESLPNRGARVRAFDLLDVRVMYEIRTLLEGYAAERAARLVKSHDLDRLRQAHRRFEDAVERGSTDELVSANLLFHRGILEIAGSPRLQKMVREVADVPFEYRAYFWHAKTQRREALRYHTEILEALERRDPEAARAAMCAHVTDALEYMSRRLAPQAPGVEDHADLAVAGDGQSANE